MLLRTQVDPSLLFIYFAMYSGQGPLHLLMKFYPLQKKNIDTLVERVYNIIID